MAEQRTNNVELMTDPPFVQVLFGSPRVAWLWTIVRVYVGWSWLTARWAKFQPRVGARRHGRERILAKRRSHS